MANDREMTFKITEHIFSLESKGSSSWTKELNLVRWNGRDPVYDLRNWNADHTRMGKGITFTNEEFEEFKNKLSNEGK